MDYMAVSELKRSKNLWNRLSASKEVVLTRDGKPGALMIEVSPANLEQVVKSVRRALFSQAISNARTKTELSPVDDEEIEREIQATRK